MGKIVKPADQKRGPRTTQHDCTRNADFPTAEQSADLPEGTVYECTEKHGDKPCGRRWRLAPPIAAKWNPVRVVARRTAGTTAAA